MAETVTMVLKVDLQCSCCYKKVKKILCRFPQIRDQTYDEKGGTVTIRVVCCDPEKLRNKLCCKGNGVIKSIGIKDPEKKPLPPENPKIVPVEKPKEPEKPKIVVPEKPKEPEKPKIVVIEKPKESEKPKVTFDLPEKPKIVVPEKPKEPEKPKIAVIEKPKESEKPKVTFDLPEKPKPTGPPPPEKPTELPKIVPPTIPGPVPVPGPIPNPPPGIVYGHPPLPLYPGPTCCSQCYGGFEGGPCFHGYGAPPPPRPYYDGYYGYWCSGHDSDNRDYRNFNRCEGYFTDENPSACSIM